MAPSNEAVGIACDLPEVSFGDHAHETPEHFRLRGMEWDEWWNLFTPRQLVALTTFSDLLGEVKELIQADAAAAGLVDDGKRLRDGGRGSVAYADAVVTYLAFAIDKCADLGNSLVGLGTSRSVIRDSLFGRQAIPMVWDYAEANPFSSSSGSFGVCLGGTVKGLLSTRVSSW